MENSSHPTGHSGTYQPKPTGPAIRSGQKPAANTQRVYQSTKPQQQIKPDRPSSPANKEPFRHNNPQTNLFNATQTLKQGIIIFIFSHTPFRTDFFFGSLIYT